MITIEFSPPSSTRGAPTPVPSSGSIDDAGGVDALGVEAVEEARAEVVGAEPADHRGGGARPGGGDGLVAALAAEEDARSWLPTSVSPGAGAGARARRGPS